MVPARYDRCYSSCKMFWLHSKNLGPHPEKNEIKWRPSSLKNLPGLMTRNNNIDGDLAAMESRKEKENKFWTFLQWGLVLLRTNCCLFPRCAKPHLRERPGRRRYLQSEFLKVSSVTDTETGHPLTYPAPSSSSSPVLVWFSVWPHFQSSFFAA